MHGNGPVLPSPGPSPDPLTGWPPPAAPAAPTGGRRLHRTPVVAGAVVAGVFAIGLGVAYAQTDPSTTTTAATPAPQVVPAPGPAQPPAHGKGFGRGHGPFGGKLFGPGHFGGHGRFGGIHGEFTVKKPDGSGYQTWASQLGEVTEVSSSSMTVRSDDGFSRTYLLDENTVVTSGRDGIGTVKTGDTVRVAGLVEDGKARAAAVMDSTSLGRIGEHWGFPRRK
jgi:hypothetical protein